MGIYDELAKCFTKDEEELITKPKLNALIKKLGLQPQTSSKSGRVKGMSMSFGDYYIFEDAGKLIVVITTPEKRPAYKKNVEKVKSAVKELPNVLVRE